MPGIYRYKDRRDAGCQLAPALRHYAGRNDAIVLALPRGGVPVGFALAKSLGLPLDVLLVRKLGMPGHEEYAMGAVGAGGVCVLQAALLQDYGVGPELVAAAIARERRELLRRERQYRGARAPPVLKGKTAILVDDGLATGASMRAAVELLRQQEPARVVIAVPVGAPDSCEALAQQVDELVCLHQPMLFRAVGQWYGQFEQVADAEVEALLAQAWHGAAPKARRGKRSLA